MIASFGDRGTEDIYNGDNTKAARQTLPRDLWKPARRKLDMVNAAKELSDLAVPPANYLEAMKGKWQGWHSIRVNDQYRVVFRWRDGNAHDVSIVDYH